MSQHQVVITAARRTPIGSLLDALAPAGAVRLLWRSSAGGRPMSASGKTNAAFAGVTVVAMRDLGRPEDVVNIHGRACALGHPIDASGARILITLIQALRRHDLTLDVATPRIGGGEALAVGLEAV